MLVTQHYSNTKEKERNNATEIQKKRKWNKAKNIQKKNKERTLQKFKRKIKKTLLMYIMRFYMSLLIFQKSQKFINITKEFS